MLVVFNPVAGGDRRRRLSRAMAALQRLGVAADVASTRAPGHAAEIAREAAGRGEGVVVAAGGDGTIAEVAAGLAGSASRLGILPLGTANVLAHELGLPGTPERAAEILAHGQPRAIHPGIARGPDGAQRLFVQMIGAGFDAAVVAGLDPAAKRRLGRMAYVLQSLRALRGYGFPRFRVELDGVAHEVESAIVTKGRLYAGRYLLAPAAQPFAPGFQVALFRGGGAGQAILAGLALPTGLLPHLPGLQLCAARHVRFLAPADAVTCVPAQADGDAAGMLPLEITDAPAPLGVILPPAT